MLNSLHYLGWLLGVAQPDTATTISERNCLTKYAYGKKRLVEVGVWHGVNTRNFRSVMSDDGILIAIDPFRRFCLGLRGFGWARRIAHAEVNKVPKGEVIWIEDLGCNAPALPVINNLLPVDFIFIDGDHSYEGLQDDWEAWSSNVKNNGIVALHDSRNRNGCGSEKFTNEVI